MWYVLAVMGSPIILCISSPAFTLVLLGGILPRGRGPDELAAAFAARITLKSWYDLVRSEPA
jgi:hypothetical protein